MIANMVIYDNPYLQLWMVFTTMTMANDYMVKVTNLIQLHGHVVMGSC